MFFFRTDTHTLFISQWQKLKLLLEPKTILYSFRDNYTLEDFNYIIKNPYEIDNLTKFDP